MTDDLEHLVLRAVKETKATLDRMDPWDHLAMMESMVQEDHQDQKEKKENQEIKEALVQEVHQELRDQRATLELQGFLAHLENKVLLESRVSLGSLESMESKEIVGFRVTLVLRVSQACKDHQASLALPVLPANREMRVSLESREILDL